MSSFHNQGKRWPFNKTRSRECLPWEKPVQNQRYGSEIGLEKEKPFKKKGEKFIGRVSESNWG